MFDYFSIDNTLHCVQGFNNTLSLDASEMDQNEVFQMFLFLGGCLIFGLPRYYALGVIRSLWGECNRILFYRIGGSCKDQALQQYAEQNQPSFKQVTN